MGRQQVTDQDRTEARRLLLRWLTDDAGDIDQLGSAAFEMHVPHHTFPGEDFPRSSSGARNRKIRFAVLATTARRAGLEPDLLDEIRFWRDDFWHYALYAAIALIRAAATNTNQPVPQLADQLAKLHRSRPRLATSQDRHDRVAGTHSHRATGSPTPSLSGVIPSRP
jgi:hypothetical protein